MLRSRLTPLLWGLCFALLLSIAAATQIQAAGSETKEQPKTSAESLYNEGLVLVAEGRHAAARVKFEQAYAMDDADADILNMLAFTMRKTGDLEDAFAFYELALEQRERFPQAREYLGEAHLQAALRQIQILASYGEEGEAELASLLEALLRAANQAAGADFEVEAAAW